VEYDRPCGKQVDNSGSTLTVEELDLRHFEKPAIDEYQNREVILWVTSPEHWMGNDTGKARSTYLTCSGKYYKNNKPGFLIYGDELANIREDHKFMLEFQENFCS
jgi:hypothetical protein